MHEEIHEMAAVIIIVLILTSIALTGMVSIIKAIEQSYITERAFNLCQENLPKSKCIEIYGE